MSPVSADRSGSPRRLLIVNADDFGLTAGVCRGIVAGHREGVITSTSVLANGPAFASGAELLAAVPQLGVGVHLAAVGEDPPLLDPTAIRSLVDHDGALDLSWRRFLPRAATGRIRTADLHREFDAQISAVVNAVGRHRITHLDTHQHLHLWPQVSAVVLDLAQRWDIPAIRITRSLGSSPVGRAVNLLASRLARRAARRCVVGPDAFAGFDEGGTLDTEHLTAVVGTLAATTAISAEIGIHPGEAGDPALDRYRWGYRWGEELAALRSPEVRAAIDSSGFTLGTFADLIPTR